MKKQALFTCLLVASATTHPGFASAAPVAASPLEGTWTLTAADAVYTDGKRIHSFGDHPQGRMMIDGQGNYILEIYRVQSKHFVSGTKATGTPEEYRDAMMRNSVHYGHVALDPNRHQIVFDVDRSVYPNWEATRQVRTYTLLDGHLSYQVPASFTGDGSSAISEWEKMAE